MLRHLVINLNGGSQSAVFNFRMLMGSAPKEIKKEETVHQLPENVDTDGMKQESQPSTVGQEEAHSKHVFH